MEYLLDKKQANPFFQDEPGMIGVWGFMQTWPKLTERKSSTCLWCRTWWSNRRRTWNCDDTAFATDVVVKESSSEERKEECPWNGRWFRMSAHNRPRFWISKWRARTSGPPEQEMGQQILYTLYHAESGWMEYGHTSMNGLRSFSCLLYPASRRLNKSSLSWMAIPLTFNFIGLELIRLAREWLLCLLSHTTHALQHLDVGVYQPVKSRCSWR